MDLTVTTLLAATSTAMQSEARISFDVRRFWGLLRSFENSSTVLYGATNDIADSARGPAGASEQLSTHASTSTGRHQAPCAHFS